MFYAAISQLTQPLFSSSFFFLVFGRNCNSSAEIRRRYLVVKYSVVAYGRMPLRYKALFSLLTTMALAKYSSNNVSGSWLNLDDKDDVNLKLMEASLKILDSSSSARKRL